ncbi:MAG: family 78 glycoside hydrolase catalytic domain [Planctomycetota bacterium]
MPHPPPFVWHPGDTGNRNVHVYFRNEFHLSGEPKKAVLCLFADSNYHLRVNGEFVGYGPVRFYPEFPEYDTYDLRPFLRRGANVIAVHVLYNGFATFHTLANKPGFVAWGSVRTAGVPPAGGRLKRREDEGGRDARGTLDLTTPGSWRCAPAAGYDPEAPRFSFAQGPIHIFDARRDIPGWDRPGRVAGKWRAPEAVAWQDAWGPLRPRSIPQLTQDTVLPVRLLAAHEEFGSEEIISFRITQSYPPHLHVAPEAHGYACTQIYSPRAQRVRCGLYWGEHFLNGREIVKEGQRPEQLARNDAELDLREGWNEFFVHCGLVMAVWEFHLAYPKSAGLEFRAATVRAATVRERSAPPLADARASDVAPDAFWIAGPYSREEAQRFSGAQEPKKLKAEHLPPLREALRALWRPVRRNTVPASPAKGLAWFEPGPDLMLDPHVVQNLPVPVARPASFTFDMGSEVLGRIFVEFDAPAGTVVDVGHAEELKGARPFLYKMVLTHAGERHIARGGPARLETFAPRGFRYLQVGVRGHSGPVTIRRVGVVAQVYPHRQRGAFECSDSLLNQLWEMGWRTLRACSEDVYTDCPWRERTLYAGDLLPEFATTLVTSADTRLARRCLDIFLQSQSPETDCQQGMAPRERAGDSLQDYPLITLLIADWYLRYVAQSSGLRQDNRAFSSSAYVSFQKMLAKLLSYRKANKLFAPPGRPFIDHIEQLKDGQVCAFNALIARAFLVLADWARRLGLEKEARVHERIGRETASATRRAFWDESAGAFSDVLVNGQPANAHAISSSAWPSCFGLTAPAQEKRILEHFRRQAEAAVANFAQSREQDARKSFCSPYGAFYLLGGLYEHGGEGCAEDFMRRFWGPMTACGPGTFWEMFHAGDSLCHAWSSAPTYYLSTRALGVRLGFPDNTDLARVVIAPQSESLDWARGVVPHPRGKVEIAWRVAGGRLVLDYSVPKGVRCEVRPQGRLGRLPR